MTLEAFMQHLESLLEGVSSKHREEMKVYVNDSSEGLSLVDQVELSIIRSGDETEPLFQIVIHSEDSE